MLSNVSIQKYLASGDIVIDPWNEGMMDAARVALHLGDRILLPEGDVVVDPKRGVLPQYREVVMTDAAPFRLEPNMFVLGRTFEKIGLSERIGSLLDGRSTLARLGLSIEQSAIIIDTGQQAKEMTLEIKNSGPHAILLYPRMKFCRACFFLLEPAASMRHDAEGKYLPGDAHKPIFKKEIAE